MPRTRKADGRGESHADDPRPALVSEQRRGDIFDSVRGPGPRLTIVFGHVGYNKMDLSWRAFRGLNPSLKDIANPFIDVESPLQIETNTWLWLVPAGVNHGMADADLIATLDVILHWAKEMGIRFVATNGIRDVDHGRDKAANRASEDRRTATLTRYMAERERVDGLTVELVSLNDVFTRYWST